MPFSPIIFYDTNANVIMPFKPLQQFDDYSTLQAQVLSKMNMGPLTIQSLQIFLQNLLPN